MALVNRIDPEHARSQLTSWLAARLGDVQDVRIDALEIPQDGGMSMTTALFSARWREGGTERSAELAARIAPPEPGMFKTPDLVREFRLLQVLAAHTDIGVATPRWLEQDPAVLGSPFLVCDRAQGRVPGDDPPYTAAGWVLDLPAERRGVLYEHAARTVGRVQAVDWRTLDLGFLSEPEFGAVGIEQQLGHWQDVYDWACAGRVSSPTIYAALEWAHANVPTDEDLTLCWGDPRIGNIVYGEDLSVQAVLDWEMATLASPELDLGWFIFFIRYYSDGIGIPIPQGLPTREQTIALWERETGRTAQHADYYEAIAALRVSILMIRAGQMMIEAGAIPADSPMSVNNPASQLLSKLCPVPEPSGAADSFIGQR